MSAYIVDDKVIDILTKAIIENGIDSDYVSEIGYNSLAMVLVNERYDYLGQLLVNQNYDSVNYRYDENDKPPVYHFTDRDIDNGLIYSAIHEYNYQSCETYDYNSTIVNKMLKDLENKMLIKYIRNDTNATKNGWGLSYY